jgi:tetratricopeptide (TPR) repeat protein
MGSTVRKAISLTGRLKHNPDDSPAIMDREAALMWIDTLILETTGERLTALQSVVLQQVWQGQKYAEIAVYYGCTEGHVKDVGAELWQVLSEHLGQKVTKGNFRVTMERYGPAPILPENPVENPVEDQHRAALAESPKLLGRSAAIAHLNTLVQQGCQIIVIQGEGGLGKTTLAQHYLHHQGFAVVLELLMAKETPNITTAERVVEEWLKQDFDEAPGLEFGVTLDRLKRQLHGRRVGVLIDNLEPALDQQGRLLAAHRNYVELLRVLADARVPAVTLITSRDRLCEPGLTVEHYRLPGLAPSVWEQFFGDRIAIDIPTLHCMHRAYGGNAKAMGILCGSIQADFEGDMVAYWQENNADPLAATDLKNLAGSQINRLQALDPQAYRLLCRLGCYRYQDIPAIPKAGLACLLWDVPITQHRQVIASLRNRSLIECAKGEYWLHPVLRAEAIDRLRLSADWEMANQQAAEFWTASVSEIASFKDALQALEAYYHYVEINQYEWAGQVILKSRHNQWQQHLPLGSTLYRMGLLQPLLNAIMQVLNNSSSEQNLSELYNILGDIYWITGKIPAAIDCQQKTIRLATQALKSLVPKSENQHRVYYLRMLEVDALLSIGLYKIDLGELVTSAELFQQVIYLAQNTAHHRWAEKASVCLALVNSDVGDRATAKTLADVAYDAIITGQQEQTGRLAYFIQILGQAYVNLGEFERATTLFHYVLTVAEESHYTQVKAKALTGLAAIQRQQANFDLACKHHETAIALLDQIGARCDLAEAYWQSSLTYQQMGKVPVAQSQRDRALHLFTEMAAPKQVAKIKAQPPPSCFLS